MAKAARGGAAINALRPASGRRFDWVERWRGVIPGALAASAAVRGTAVRGNWRERRVGHSKRAARGAVWDRELVFPVTKPVAERRGRLLRGSGMNASALKSADQATAVFDHPGAL
jgi:hypothetical protein